MMTVATAVTPPASALDLAHAHNPEVERAVLGVVLDSRNAGSWWAVREHSAGPLAFHQRNHQLIAMVIDDLASRGAAYDVQQVAAAAAQVRYGDAVDALRAMRGDTGKRPELPRDASVGYEDSLLQAIGGHNPIADLAAWAPGAWAPVSGLPRNVAILADLHRRRLVIADLADALREAQAVGDGARLAGLVDRVVNRLCATIGNGQAVDSIARGAEQALAEHDAAAAAGGLAACAFGIPSLDEGLRLLPGAMVVLAARPGCGKTSLLLQAAKATRDMHGAGRVALISLEMTTTDLGRILIGREIGVGKSQVLNGYLTTEQRERFAVATAAWSDNDIPCKGHGGRGTVDEVCAWIRAMHQRSGGRLMLVGIDYLQLINATNPRATTNDALGEITRKLKLIALDLRLCVLLLCQMNREAVKESRLPRATDLRGSGNIEQDADAVLFLWGDPDQKPAVMPVHAIVAKNRFGAEFMAPLHFMRAQGQVLREAPRIEIREPPPASSADARERAAKTSREPSDREDLFNGGGR